MDQVPHKQVGRQRQGPRHTDVWSRRILVGTWNVTSLAEKEPELMREVECYHLDILRLISMYSTVSGTKHLARGLSSWSKEHQVGVWMLIKALTQL